MQVDVISSVVEARADDFIHKTVIVIDVLRATSTIVTALAHGCSAVIPVETVQQARQLQEGDDRLGGERFCKKIAGFHYGNSPFEYMDPELEGKRVILTTTNGTRAIQKTQRAYRVLAGSLLNAEACVKAALSLGRDMMIVCAGTQDVFSLEDGLCAGLLVRELEHRLGEPPEVNDFGIAMRQAYESVMDRLDQTLLDCANGKRLTKIGYCEDVLFCSQLNRYSLVPVLKDQTMIRF